MTVVRVGAGWCGTPASVCQPAEPADHEVFFPSEVSFRSEVSFGSLVSFRPSVTFRGFWFPSGRRFPSGAAGQRAVCVASARSSLRIKIAILPNNPAPSRTTAHHPGTIAIPMRRAVDAARRSTLRRTGARISNACLSAGAVDAHHHPIRSPSKTQLCGQLSVQKLSATKLS